MTEEINIENLQKLIEEDKQKRIAACQAELEQLLVKYNCRIVPEVVLSENRIVSRLVLLAN